MNTDHSTTSKATRRISRVLALLSITALGLAASPTALASERGGPGTPGVQQLDADTYYFPVPRNVLQQYASWSD
jgi:hypothetical protein